MREAIDSLLAQTFSDFELIISDNASSDRTGEICREYAARDPRIRYHRNPVNIGGANNENLTFNMARGEYFRWAAHDDVCAPTLIEKCVAVLDERPEVVICYSMITLIDEHGAPTHVVSENDALASRPHERFAAVASHIGFGTEFYGLVRSSILRQTQLQKSYTGSDRTLLAEISLRGPFHEIPEPLFFKRLHPANTFVDWRVRMAWFDEKYRGRIVLPFWSQMFDYFATLKRVQLSPTDRIHCYLYMVKWLGLFGKNLVKDVLVALYMLGSSPSKRKKRYADLSNWS